MAKSKAAVVVRVIAAVCYLIASIVMFTSKQKLEREISIESVDDETQSALLFFAVINIVVCVYNLLILPIPAYSLLWRLIVLFDLIFCILTVTSLGIGWYIHSQFYEVNINSIYRICRSPICGYVPDFCVRILWCLICSTVAFVFHFLLLAYSSLLTTGLLDDFV